MREPKANAAEVERLLREARIQARLDHPAIVPVHEVGTDSGGNPYFTMKRVTGTTLAAVLARGDEKRQRLLRAFVDVCQAVELAHSRLVVHRDLKPSNIMLGDYGEVYVLDWGVARVLSDRSASTGPDTAPGREPVPGLTQAGAILGTPGYMAPEQLLGQPIGIAADVYSLGAILFEILVGEPLHKPAGAIASTLAGELQSPALRRPERDIPPELDLVCRVALADDPTQRPSARELADRVQAYLDGDRDHERRRQLAADQLAAARTALDAGRRAEAIHAAGRALALDPASIEAAELVTSLIVEPPREIPPEVERGLDDIEDEIVRTRSRRSIVAYLAIFIMVPILPFVEIADWPLLIAVFAAACTLAAMQWFNSRTARIPAHAVMAGNVVLVVLFSRISGTLMLTPLLICAVLLAMGSREIVARRPSVVALWAVVAVLTPVALERLGVLAPTFAMTADGVVSAGTIIASRTPLDLAALVGGNVAFAVLVGLYGTAITRGRFEAQRRMHVQAWHLSQLLPERASGRPLGIGGTGG
jgi:serine/threonine-protein kinase